LKWRDRTCLYRMGCDSPPMMAQRRESRIRRRWKRGRIAAVPARVEHACALSERCQSRRNRESACARRFLYRFGRLGLRGRAGVLLSGSISYFDIQGLALFSSTWHPGWNRPFGLMPRFPSRPEVRLPHALASTGIFPGESVRSVVESERNVKRVGRSASGRVSGRHFCPIIVMN
jgi:hypothetical protein